MNISISLGAYDLDQKLHKMTLSRGKGVSTAMVDSNVNVLSVLG